MVIGPDVTTDASPEQFEEIDALLRAAFGRPEEAELVRRLRADSDIWAELVKSWGGRIAGYAALAQMREPEGWACLAPLAVLPRLQNAAAAPPPMAGDHRYRIGTQLASEIALWARQRDLTAKRDDRFPAAIVVLGSVPFYERAGFSAARAQNLRSPYPTENTLIAAPGDDAPAATLVYPRAFDGL